jgi:hypothetical protein
MSLELLVMRILNLSLKIISMSVNEMAMQNIHSTPFSPGGGGLRENDDILHYFL